MALIKAMDKLQSQSTSNPNSIAQAAAVEALTGPQESIEAMRKVFEERRDLVVEMLNQAPGMNCHKPEGAFYVYPSIAWLHRQDQPRRQADHRRRELRHWRCWTRKAWPRCTARAFCYPGHFRISYANATEELRDACRRIQHFCEGLH